MRLISSVLALFFLGSLSVLADESVRRVQEELRRRNIYFGDVDGRMSPGLAAAIKFYQERKGFTPSGEIDTLTAGSLHALDPAAGEAASLREWPDVPVLKSDTARDLPPAEQAALQRSAAEQIDVAPTPEAAAKSSTGPPAPDPERIARLVRDYLDKGETDDLAAQTQFYAYPVDYFDHGRVNENFVHNDTRRYVERWPERKYILTAPVKATIGLKKDEAQVEFSIAFSVRNKQHHVVGETLNFWTLQRKDKEWKIVAIREKHVPR